MPRNQIDAANSLANAIPFSFVALTACVVAAGPFGVPARPMSKGIHIKDAPCR